MELAGEIDERLRVDVLPTDDPLRATPEPWEESAHAAERLTARLSVNSPAVDGQSSVDRCEFGLVADFLPTRIVHIERVAATAESIQQTLLLDPGDGVGEVSGGDRGLVRARPAERPAFCTSSRGRRSSAALRVLTGQHTTFLPALHQPRPFEESPAALGALTAGAGTLPSPDPEGLQAKVLAHVLADAHDW